MCCFDETSGEVIWDFMTDDLIRSYPAIGNGNVYYSVTFNDTYYDYSSNTAEGVIGVDINNGNIVLSILREEYYYNSRGLVFSNERIFALVDRLDYRLYDDTNWDHYYPNMYLICFSTSGDTIWEEKMDEQIWGYIILGNGKIFLSRYDQLSCYGLDTHNELWGRQWGKTIDISRNDGTLLTKDKLIIFFFLNGGRPSCRGHRYRYWR